MTTPTAARTEHRVRAWPMYRALVGMGIACAVAIAVAYAVTLPVIEQNRAEALERAIFAVLPAAVSRGDFVVTADRQIEPAVDTISGTGVIHAGYDTAGRLVGFAIVASGMGYQDVIRLLYGYSPEAQAVVGLRVLEMRETPGLGDKIATDPTFVANFTRLDVALTGDGSALAHPLETVKPGDKRHAWQIDGITGATISSRAVGSILRQSTATWVPLLNANLEQFGSGEASGSQ